MTVDRAPKDSLGTILLVENNLHFKEHYQTLLTEAGYDVISCEDGTVALARYKNRKPVAIIVTDADMNMNGKELIKAVRRQDANTPILMASTDFDDRTFIDDLKNEKTHFLYKGDIVEDPGNLVSALQKLVSTPTKGGARRP